jgi:hypothetical protein
VTGRYLLSGFGFRKRLWSQECDVFATAMRRSCQDFINAVVACREIGLELSTRGKSPFMLDAALLSFSSHVLSFVPGSPSLIIKAAFGLPVLASLLRFLHEQRE